MQDEGLSNAELLQALSDNYLNGIYAMRLCL